MAVDLAQEFASSAAQDAAILRTVFQTITAESCPHTFNFHMHTVCSDGRLQPEQLIEQAIAIGLQGLAITDHHSVMGYYRAQTWLDHQTPAQRPQLWVGMEVNANLLGEEVHILGYAFDPQHSIIQPYLQGRTTTGEFYKAAQVIAAIHQAGGLAVLAHPARCLEIDGVETYYAYTNPSPWEPSPRQTKEIKALSAQHGLLNTCGTDTHGLSLLQRL
jgi:predicted metal-dependent phosphoesterase TrpH